MKLFYSEENVYPWCVCVCVCVYAKLSYFWTLWNGRKNVTISDSRHPQLFSETARKTSHVRISILLFYPVRFSMLPVWLFRSPGSTTRFRVDSRNYGEKPRKIYSPIAHVQTDEWRERHSDEPQIKNSKDPKKSERWLKVDLTIDVTVFSRDLR